MSQLGTDTKEQFQSSVSNLMYGAVNVDDDVKLQLKQLSDANQTSEDAGDSVVFEEKRPCGCLRGHRPFVYIMLVIVVAMAAAIAGLSAALIVKSKDSSVGATTPITPGESTTERQTSTSHTTMIHTTTVTTPPTPTTIYLTIEPTTEPTEPTTEPPELSDAEKSRIDCWPEARYGSDPGSEADCRARGCRWDPSPFPGVPPCFVSAEEGIGIGYEVPDASAISSTDTGITVKLHSRDSSAKLMQTIFVFEATYYGENILNFRLYEDGKNSYQVADDVLKLNLPSPSGESPSMGLRYRVDITSMSPFAFTVLRNSDDTVLWDTNIGGLLISDQLNMISTRLPSANIYGFGENRHRSFRHETDFQTWGMFARDQAVSPGNKNLYGVHPFYTCMEESGLSHGVLLLNSNAMDYSLSPLPALTLRSTGGILDFYMFLGPDPEAVIQQYTGVIGRPFIPPYWSLGFQLCRYGYNNLQNMTAATSRTLDAGIPLDVQYADIDHFDQRRVFTIDPINFGGLPEYFSQLRKDGMRTIIILNPTFDITSMDYEPYRLGLSNDIYIKWPTYAMMPPGDIPLTNTRAMVGYVWPTGRVVFPDFFHPRTEAVWSKLIEEHIQRIPFDGLWVDMNEPANFGTNEEKPWNWPEGEPAWSLKCPDSNNTWETPPHRTFAEYGHDEETRSARGTRARLSDKTLCMVAEHGNGQIRHYDVHSLHGAATVLPTLSALRAVSGERSLVVSRSTFVGSGRLAGHWLGDNYATWDDMKHSIIGMLEFNLFGIPYIGADICGFFGDTTANLCKRWLQLGAFYPYSRSHNNMASQVENDPASFNEEVTTAAREAITTRYELLPYLYTLFYQAHVLGGTVVRPLHHVFPADTVARGIDKQFMWGSAILFSPILTDDDQILMDIYLPGATWYNLAGSRTSSNSHGEWRVQSYGPLSPMPIFVRGGTILVIQDSANNTRFSRQEPFHLKVYLDEMAGGEEGTARGELYWDDGDAIDPYENRKYSHISYNFRKNKLTANIVHGGYDMSALTLHDVYIMGIAATPGVIRTNDNVQHYDFLHDGDFNILHIRNLNLQMNTAFTLEVRTQRLPTEEEARRVECLPDVDVSYSVCLSRGCVWSPGIGPEGVPRCSIHPHNNNYRYVDELVYTHGRGRQVNLQPSGRGSMMPEPFPKLIASIEHRAENVIRVKIAPTNDVERYVVPIQTNLPNMEGSLGSREYVVEYETDPTKGFYIRIVRNKTKTVIWDTSLGGLTFSEQYMQLSTTVPTTRVYGLGEHDHPTLRHSFTYRTWPIFARGNTQTREGNLHGSHPYYLCVEDDEGHTHGSLLLNSNAMEVVLQETPAVTYRVTGGILDFYVILGDSAESVTQTYNTILGRPFLPPYWALGFHMARSDYGSLSNVRKAQDAMANNNIPLDVQHLDVEYTNGTKAFTVDDLNFNGLADFMKSKADSGIRTIIRMDSAVLSAADYAVYTDGVSRDAFVKWPQSAQNPDHADFGNEFIHGYVHTNGGPPVVYPDFLNLSTHQWWSSLIHEHHGHIPFHGLSLHSNEPLRLNAPTVQMEDNWTPSCPPNVLDDPIYMPASLVGERLSDGTLCMVGEHQHSTGRLSHYDVHNVYCHSHTTASAEGLHTGTGERGLVITSATFPSMGQTAGHGFGDTTTGWDALRQSIINMLEFNIFGIPYVGADICGYRGEPEPELYARWMQLGSFYPLARTNNAPGHTPRSPVDFGPMVVDVARKALETRYSLLPHLYTLFFHVHVGNQGTVLRPLFHEFPEDSVTYDIGDQFMWGPSLLVSPVLTANTFQVNPYIPEGRWFDYYQGREVADTRRHVSVSAPIDMIPLHVRGGHIIVQQVAALNTDTSRQNYIHLLVAPNEDTQAAGDFVQDDGVSVDTVQNGEYSLYEFQYSPNTIRMTVKHFHEFTRHPGAVLKVDRVRVLGVPSRPVYVHLLARHLYSYLHQQWTYREDTQELVLFDTNSRLYLYDDKDEWTIKWSTEAEVPTTTSTPPGTTPATTAVPTPPRNNYTNEERARVDCYPEARENPEAFSVDEEACDARGCAYDTDATPGAPPCFVSREHRLGWGYTVGEVLRDDDTGMRINLVAKQGTASRKKRETKPNAIFEVNYYGENIIGFRLYPDTGPRYRVPEDVVPMNLPAPGSSRTRQNRYRLETSEADGVFSFVIIRQSDGAILWNTSMGGMSLEDQLLMISTRLPSFNVYGFGENSHLSFRHDPDFRTWGLFARDEWVTTDDANHYGVHPFYTCLEPGGKSHGVLLLNSNAMDYTVSPLPGLTYRAIGGILDFYMFLGPSPENVIQQYTEVIGRPYMPPYWSLGFQLCRYGYNNLSNMMAAVDRTLHYEYPLDVQYADIDTYDVRKVFTVDPVHFAGLREYFHSLRDKGIHTVIILDPTFIVNETDYEPHDLAMEQDIYITWPDRESRPEGDYDVTNSTTMIGFVWPMGKVGFPDFLLERTNDLWEKLIIEHWDRIPFDGLWIDMNEPANFGTNEERPWNWPEDARPYWSLQCPEGSLDDPPYTTLAVTRYGNASRLSEKTLCMVGKQKDGAYDHYDVHNLYGPGQIASTLRALRNVTGKRGIVVGRSTFVGSGHLSGHWLGDNFATWESLRMSIIGMLEFNLFGFPYIGADICGFFGDTNLNLCKRWTQLGAFYPYARSHNQADSVKENDPGFWADDLDFYAVTLDAFRVRYSLLPYLYTLFYHSHTSGHTVVRPLFHEFPQDEKTYGIDKQFMWGGALLISPIMDDDSVTSLSYYLPRGRWFNYYTDLAEHYAVNPGQEYTTTVRPDTKIPLHLRGGHIIPTQDYANNTRYSRENPFHLLVVLDDEDQYQGKAKGDFFWDDGESMDTIENGNYYYARFESSDKTLSIRVEHNSLPEMSERVLADISVYGVNPRPAVIIINGETEHYDFTYNQQTQKLVINNLNWAMDFSEEVHIDWGSPPLPTQQEMERIECLPDTWRDLSTCEQRGCILAPSAGPSGVPRCYLDVENFGYRLKSSSPDEMTLGLEWLGKTTMFGGDYDDVTLVIEELSDHVLRVKIAPSGVERFGVPLPLNQASGNTGTRDYVFEYEDDVNKTFHFRIKRASTGTYIWDTSVGGLAVAEQFLQIASRLPSMDVYGIGENEHHSFRHDFNFKTWPLFSRDQPPSYLGNLYGVHPYYTCVEDGAGNSHGVFLLNSNAMEIGFQPSPQINYRVIGGVLDFYYIFGDNPDMVTQRYTELIGRPYFPPYWALGFQLSRYGYENITNLKAAVDRTIDAKIPFDVQYGDIDHFDANRDFTYDKDNFPGLPEYFQSLRDRGMKTIIILDPALIGVDPTYEPFTTGRDLDVFIKWPAGENPQFERFNNDFMHGYVWPEGEAVFPDYFLNSTQTWWKDWIVKWYNEGVPFDGLWIDMNEPANFDTNQEKPWNWPESREPWNLICPESKWDDPPYKPNSIWGDRLSDKTLCMVGTQMDGTARQYDTHSLYGWSQSEPTLRAMQAAIPGKRGMVISRSTFPHSGTTTGHWLGDNASVWSHLFYSIIGMLEFNLFGIPYIGADICGYFNDVTDEMCERWMQLGAFYTFSRNHNGLGYRDQDPGYLGDEVAASSRQALETRYTLLPYLYTLHYRAHVDGNTVIRPLHHEFYMDLVTRGIDRQFLWGPALLISPVLDQGHTTVDAYFPAQHNEDCWYDYYTGRPMTWRQMYRTIDAPLDHIPLHVRGGYILPTQPPANTTHFSRQKPLGLIVAPNLASQANGELFWDDGDSLDTISNNMYALYNFLVQQNDLYISKSHAYNTGLTLDDIRWFGIQNAPQMISINATQQHTEYHYNAVTKELFIYNLQLVMEDPWTISLS